MINLLWNGIAKYIKNNNVRYLFGSARLNSQNPIQVNEVFSFIKERYYAPEEFRVYPVDHLVFPGLKDNTEVLKPKEIFRGLPALVKGYLRLGVKVCGPPARNPDFDSIVLFVLLDMHKASNSYKRHFLDT